MFKVHSAGAHSIIESLGCEHAAVAVGVRGLSVVPANRFVGRIHQYGFHHAGIAGVVIRGKHRVRGVVEQRRSAGHGRGGEAGAIHAAAGRNLVRLLARLAVPWARSR